MYHITNSINSNSSVTVKILAPRNNPICPPTFAEKLYNDNGYTLWYQTLQMVGVFGLSFNICYYIKFSINWCRAPVRNINTDMLFCYAQ